MLSIASLRSILRRFLDSSADVVSLAHNDFRGERATDVIRITFQNVFVIFHRCYFLLDSTSFFFLLFFFHHTVLHESIPSTSPTRSFLIDRETRVLHPLLLGEIWETLCEPFDRSLRATKSATRQNILVDFLDISRAISRRETPRVRFEILLANFRWKIVEEISRECIDSFRKEKFIIVHDSISHFGFLLFTRKTSSVRLPSCLYFNCFPSATDRRFHYEATGRRKEFDS